MGQEIVKDFGCDKRRLLAIIFYCFGRNLELCENAASRIEMINCKQFAVFIITLKKSEKKSTTLEVDTDEDFVFESEVDSDEDLVFESTNICLGRSRSSKG